MRSSSAYQDMLANADFLLVRWSFAIRMRRDPSRDRDATQRQRQRVPGGERGAGVAQALWWTCDPGH